MLNTFKGKTRDGFPAAEVHKDASDDRFVPLTELMVFLKRLLPEVILLWREIPIQL